MHILTAIKVNFITLVLGMAFALVIGYAVGYFLRKLFTEYQIKEAEARRQKIIDEAEKEVENRLKSAEIEAREKSLAVKSDFEKEIKTKRDSFRDQEKELEQKEREFKNEFEKFKSYDDACSVAEMYETEFAQKPAVYKFAVDIVWVPHAGIHADT